MTPEQINALTNYCLLSVETINPRFAWGSPSGTHVLTVNAGYE
jgi:hypothetical protein